METSGGIQQNNVEAVVLCVPDTFLSDLHRVGLTHFEHVRACLFANYFQLVDSRRSVDIACYQQRAVILRDEVLCELCAVCGLTGAL